jgi:hypothetical protein
MVERRPSDLADDAERLDRRCHWRPRVQKERRRRRPMSMRRAGQHRPVLFLAGDLARGPCRPWGGPRGRGRTRPCPAASAAAAAAGPARAARTLRRPLRSSRAPTAWRRAPGTAGAAMPLETRTRRRLLASTSGHSKERAVEMGGGRAIRLGTRKELTDLRGGGEVERLLVSVSVPLRHFGRVAIFSGQSQHPTGHGPGEYEPRQRGTPRAHAQRPRDQRHY